MVEQGLLKIVLSDAFQKEQLEPISRHDAIKERIEETKILDLCIDSRLATSGSAFFALPGEQSNGHRYLSAALDKGSVFFVIDKREKTGLAESFLQAQSNNKSIVIFQSDDVLASLLNVAQTYREQLDLGLRIGITGSNGKTTVKNLLFSVLSNWKKSWKTPGNYNSILGLPVAISQISDSFQYSVFEMAMSEVGEMEQIAKLVSPNCAIITNIGTAHIGNIGSKEGIAKEKFDITSSMDASGFVLVPENEPLLEKLIHGFPGEAIPYGEQSCEGYLGSDLMAMDRQVLHFDKGDIEINHGGENFRSGVLAVYQLCRGLGLPFDSIAQGLTDFYPDINRGRMIYDDVDLFFDCYNANPESMSAVLDLLEANQKAGNIKGEVVLVLADMKELGTITLDAHKALIKRIESMSSSVSQLVFLLGEDMKEAYEALSENNNWKPEYVGTDKITLTEKLRQKIQKGMLILAKGSRSMELETIIQQLPYWKGQV